MTTFFCLTITIVFGFLVSSSLIGFLSSSIGSSGFSSFGFSGSFLITFPLSTFVWGSSSFGVSCAFGFLSSSIDSSGSFLSTVTTLIFGTLISSSFSGSFLSTTVTLIFGTSSGFSGSFSSIVTILISSSFSGSFLSTTVTLIFGTSSGFSSSGFSGLLFL